MDTQQSQGAGIYEMAIFVPFKQSHTGFSTCKIMSIAFIYEIMLSTWNTEVILL